MEHPHLHSAATRGGPKAAWFGVLFLGLAVAAGSAACTGCKQRQQEAAAKASASAESDAVLGRIIWHSLVSSDPAAAAAFYTDVMGWTSRGGEGGAATLLNGNDPIGSITFGEKSYWSGTVLVADVDGTARLARENGGSVPLAPTDSPSARFAVLGDPVGGFVDVSRPTTPVPARDTSKPGEFYWCEYGTTDVPSALRFYGKLFGWASLEDGGAPPPGTPTFFGRNGVPVGSMHTEKAGLANGWWLFFVQVADIDAAINRALAKGATVLSPPTKVSDGVTVVLNDPQGAVIALHQATKAP